MPTPNTYAGQLWIETRGLNRSGLPRLVDVTFVSAEQVARERAAEAAMWAEMDAAIVEQARRERDDVHHRRGAIIPASMAA